MKRVLLISTMLLMCVINVFAQQKVTIQGVVSDANGPLMGVGVIEKGTTNGVVTDLDGRYTLSVTKGATVEFSSLGYIAVEKAVNAAGTVDVTLEEDNLTLEETVVVGYGVQKKSDVTGAIASVKSEDLANRSVTELGSSLQGKTAGLQIVTTSGAPGASSTVRVRGYSSNSSSDPLYVVDGLRTTSISDIDPNDIESIEVLKDAASAAIYGAQAGNGVILVTTKKAKKGISKVTYDLQLTAQNVARVPEVLNAKEYIQWVTEGNLVTQDRINTFYDGKTDTNWADVAFETGSIQRHNLSISGANDRASVYASFSYLTNDGPVIGKQDYNKRITGSLNADYKIFDWLKFSTNNSFSKSNTKTVRNGGMYSMMASVIQMDPLTPVTYSKDNLPSHMKSMLEAGHSFLTDANGDYYSMSPFQESNNINPYIMRDGYQSQSGGYNLHGSTALDLTPFKTVTITSRIGYDFNNTTSYTLQWPHTVNTDTTNDYVAITANDATNWYYQWENFVNYNETFNKVHQVSAMAGMSFQERTTYNVYGSVQGSSSSNIGITKLDRNYAYFANATGTATKSVSGGEELRYANLSYFGRVNYSYDNKYFVQASLRADAADTSILPLNTRWGYFPAASLGWTVSRENWWQNLNLRAISNFKLRASWGQNGSIAGLGSYMYAATITSPTAAQYAITSEKSYSVGSYPSSTGNNNLKWETSEQLDLGFDLRMFKDRLSFGFDWYKKTTKDLIMTGISSSLEVGNTLSPINAGNVENKGLEFDLSWNDAIGDFNYGIKGNVSTLKNKVTYIYETLSRVSGSAGGSGVTCYFEKGYPMWYMRGYEYAGVDPETGYATFVDQNNDNVINDNDKVMIGSGIPKVNYGLTLTASWKGIDALVFASGAAGNDVCWGVPRSTRTQANILKYFYDRRWTSTNHNAEYPGAAGNLHNYDKYCSSSALVFDGSYVKIKQIQLGYSFPKALLSKIKLSNARLYVSLDDWFSFSKYPGFDPEVSLSGQGLGIDYGQYPVTKKTVFGLNITF